MSRHRGVRAALVLCTLAVSVICAAPAAADWRNGCPPIDQPRPRSGAFGRSGDLDTALGVSRVEVRYARLGWQGLAADTMRAHGHVQHSGGFFLDASLGSAYVHRRPRTQAIPTGFYLGNLVGAVGFRSSGYLIGGAFRHGVSVKVGVGASPWTSQGHEGEDHLDGLNVLADNHPFQVALFAHDRPLLGSLEGRLELIGCRGPYVRGRFDTVAWRPTRSDLPRNESPSAYAMPISLAVGAYMYSTILLELQYGIEPRFMITPDDVTVPAFEYQHDHPSHIGLYADWQPFERGLHRYLHVGLFADLFPERSAGWQVGAALAYDFRRSFKRGDVLE